MPSTIWQSLKLCMANFFGLVRGKLFGNLDANGFQITSAGGITLTAGHITLFQAPALPAHAASKSYTDALVAALAAAPVTQGRGLVVAGATVHFAQSAAYTPNQIPFASGASAIGFSTGLTFDDATDLLTVAGGITLTGGDVTLFQAPSSNLHAATKLYVDSAATAATPVQGRGVVLAGTTINFAQNSDYTAGLLPYASGTTAIGFASGLSWDSVNSRLTVANQVYLSSSAPRLQLRDTDGTAGQFSTYRLSVSGQQCDFEIWRNDEGSVLNIFTHSGISNIFDWTAGMNFFANCEFVTGTTLQTDRLLVDVPHGYMYQNDVNTVVTITVANTYVAIGAGFTGANNSGFTFQNNHELVAAYAGKYLVTMSASITIGNNDVFEIGVTVNGSLTTVEGETKSNSAGDTQCLSATGIITLAANDIVRMAVNNNIDAHDPTIDHASLTLVRVGN